MHLIHYKILCYIICKSLWFSLQCTEQNQAILLHELSRKHKFLDASLFGCGVLGLVGFQPAFTLSQNFLAQSDQVLQLGGPPHISNPF